MPSVETLKALYDTIREMDAVELRLGADNTMYIIHCTAQEAKEVLRVTEDGANTLFETSVCCVGAEICQQGVRDSQRLYRICVEATRSANIPDGALPQIHISGCSVLLRNASGGKSRISRRCQNGRRQAASRLYAVCGGKC